MYHSHICLSVAFLVIYLFSAVSSIPVAAREAPDACTPDNWPNCNQPPETSVYFCENINWQPPCYVFPLARDENGALYNWKANNVGSPWPDNSWTVGSIGPAKGINLMIQSENGEIGQGSRTSLAYPGLNDVGDFWRDNIYTFVASWDPGLEPGVKAREAGKEGLTQSSNAEVDTESGKE